MARKFDRHVDQMLRLRMAEDHCTKLRRQLRLADEQRKAALGSVLKTMGTSVEATIEGKPVFEIIEKSRRSVHVETVIELCDEDLASKLIVVTTNKSVKWL